MVSLVHGNHFLSSQFLIPAKSIHTDKISDDYDQFQNAMLFRSCVSHESWLLLIILL